MINIAIFSYNREEMVPPVKKIDPWRLPRTNEEKEKLNAIENEIIDIINKSNVTNDEFKIILHDLEKAEKDPIIKLSKR